MTREIENYITLVSSMLRLSKTQREEIGTELRDHLDTRVEALTEAGYSREEAVRMSLEEFGDAAGLAVQFVSVVHEHRKRWMMRFATFSIAGIFCLIIGAMAMWPKDARFGGPQKGIAQEDPFAKNSTKKNNDPFAGKKVTEPAAQQKAQKKAAASDENEFAKVRKRNAMAEKVLDTVIDLEHDETPWGEVLTEISDKYGVHIYLGANAEDAGLGSEELVTLNFKKVRLRTILTTFLKQHDFTFVVQDGMIVIDENSHCPYAVKTFNCQKILELMPQTARVSGGGGNRGGGLKGPAKKSGGGLPSSGGGTGGSAGAGIGGTVGIGGDVDVLSLLGGNTGVDPEKQLKIISLLEKMVAPDSWDTTNGAGSMEFAGEILIIRQHGPQLHQVGQVLDDLQTLLQKQYPDEK